MSSFLLLGAGTDASAGGGAVAAAFDPASLDFASFTFSNGNSTITSTAASFKAVRSTTSHSSGKFGFRFTGTSGGNNTIGVCNATFAGGNYVGSDTNGTGAQYVAGTGVFHNAVSIATLFSAANSDNIDVMVDIGGGLIWYKDVTSGSNWNNNVSADPASGTGGISISVTGALYIGASAGTTGTTFTLALPTLSSGFSYW